MVTMKAVTIAEYGSSDVLQVREIAKPQPKSGEVLVKVHASTINDIDWALVRGKPYPYRLMFGVTKPKITIPGAEIAGVVETVGEDISAFKKDQRVFGDISMKGLGGWAEYVSVPATTLTPIPSTMNFQQAVALPHASLLALQGLVTIGKIKKGERVLINGAGGAVGITALQLAKMYNCHVTGVDKDVKLSTLTSLGFDEVLDYEKVDFVDRGIKYDLILDTKTTFSSFRYPKVLKKEGRYVTVGGYLPKLIQIVFTKALIKKLTHKEIKILSLKPNEGLDHICQLFDKRAVKPVLDNIYTLEEAKLGLSRFGQAQHIGKIIVSITE